jgi:hypothetical protein
MLTKILQKSCWKLVLLFIFYVSFKNYVLKTDSKPVVLLGRGRTFKRWSLVGRWKLGHCCVPFKGILGSYFSLLHLCFPVAMKVSSFASLYVPQYKILPCHGFLKMESMDHELKPWKPVSWNKSFPLSIFPFFSYLVTVAVSVSLSSLWQNTWENQLKEEILTLGHSFEISVHSHFALLFLGLWQS